MKILVTGASGFIGSALAKRLEEEGHDVYGLYRYVADGRYDFYQLDKHLTCDIRDRERLFKCIEELMPDVVYHLAAITPVSYSFMSPVEVTEVNYIGTLNLVDACKANDVGHFINASTSEFYGEQEHFPIYETAIPKPLSPYSVSKLAAEEYIRFKARTEEFPYTIIRPYNTYNRSNVKKEYFVIERAITQGLRDGHIHLYTPEPVRDFLDRDSHVDAYMKCLGREAAIGQEINIGTSRGVTVGKAVEMVAHIIGSVTGKEPDISWDMKPDRPYDIETLICSNKKAQFILGWKPLYTLEEGLRLAIREWQEVLRL